MERTTVTLPKELVRKAQKATRAKSQTQAVVIALEEAIRMRKISEFKKLAGQLKFYSDTAERRHKDKRLG